MATSYPLRVIQLVVMLSSPWSLRITVIHVLRPVVVGGRKEFCSRAIPGPGLSQNPALSGPPPQKCKARMPSVTCLGFSSLSAIFAVRASCRLPQLRCWVAPSSKAVCPAGPATPLLLPPLLGKPSACSTWTLFRHTAAGMNPVRRVSGAQEAAVPAAGADIVGLFGGQTAKDCAGGGASVQGLRPLAFILRISLVTGRAGPDPGGRLPLAQAGGLCRRPGAWGPPSVVPSKPVRGSRCQTASGASAPVAALLPRPWWFRDSKPGARF